MSWDAARPGPGNHSDGSGNCGDGSGYYGDDPGNQRDGPENNGDGPDSHGDGSGNYAGWRWMPGPATEVADLDRASWELRHRLRCWAKVSPGDWMWDFKPMVHQGVNLNVKIKHTKGLPWREVELICCGLEGTNNETSRNSKGREVSPGGRRQESLPSSWASLASGVSAHVPRSNWAGGVVGMGGSETQNAHLFLYTENMKQCKYEVYHPVHFLFGDKSTWELNEGQRLLAELGLLARGSVGVFVLYCHSC